MIYTRFLKQCTSFRRYSESTCHRTFSHICPACLDIIIIMMSTLKNVAVSDNYVEEVERNRYTASRLKYSHSLCIVVFSVFKISNLGLGVTMCLTSEVVADFISKWWYKYLLS